MPGSSFRTQVRVGVQKYFQLKWYGNTGLSKVLLLLQIALPAAFMLLAYAEQYSEQYFFLDDYQHTLEHEARTLGSSSPLLVPPFPNSCPGLDMRLAAGAAEHYDMLGAPELVDFTRALSATSFVVYAYLGGPTLDLILGALLLDPDWQPSAQTFALTGPQAEAVKAELDAAADGGVEALARGYRAFDACPPQEEGCQAAWLLAADALAGLLGQGGADLCQKFQTLESSPKAAGVLVSVAAVLRESAADMAPGGPTCDGPEGDYGEVDPAAVQCVSALSPALKTSIFGMLGVRRQLTAQQLAPPAPPELPAPRPESRLHRARQLRDWVQPDWESPPRRLAQCEETRDPCACTDACSWDHYQCAADGSPGLCVQTATVNEQDIHARRTSCLECPTQASCSSAELWARLGASLDGMRPKVRVFASAADVDAAVQGAGYESGGVETGSVKKGDTPFCGAIHFTDRGDSRVDFRVQLNGSAAPLNAVKATTAAQMEQHFASYLSDFGGQLRLQQFVEDWVLGGAGAPSRTLAFMPFPVEAKQWNLFLEELAWFVHARLLNFGFIVVALSTTTTVFRERVQNLRDGLQMMGLTDAAFYTTVYCFFAVWSCLPVLLALFMLTSPPGLPSMVPLGSRFLLFILLWLHVNCCLAIALAFTTISTRKPVVIMMTYITMDFSILLVIAISQESSVALRWLLAIAFPVVGLFQGFGAFMNIEASHGGLNLSNVALRAFHVDKWSVADSYLSMLLNWAVWTLLYLYLDQVLAAPTKQPWRFPMTWVLRKLGVGQQSLQHEATEEERDPKYFELTDASHLELEKQGRCVKVEQLTKTFQTGGLVTKAVRGLDLTMYEGEIFCLLGHNGAGKTTAIHCLTGLETPSSGSATAFGQPLEEFRAKNRKDIGFCPQHSVLWLELSPFQHLMIFAQLKGADRAASKSESVHILEQLGMRDKTHTPVRALSGGMQRKLSLGIAFVLNPRLVFLDEPSSGMDATARQESWDFLRLRRENTIILLTTHYMDEADTIGDRVGVMSGGVAQCCGAPTFLKTAYSCGYSLRFLFNEDKVQTAPAQITGLVEAAIGGKLSSSTGTGTEFAVTVRVDDAGAFPALFPKLDGLVQDRAIKEWSVSVCSLEEVFLRVADGTHTDAQPKTKAALPDTRRGTVSTPLQVRALMQRRMRYLSRSWLYAFCQMLAPALYMALVFAVITVLVTTETGTLAVTFDAYSPTSPSEIPIAGVAGADVTGLKDAEEFKFVSLEYTADKECDEKSADTEWVRRRAVEEDEFPLPGGNRPAREGIRNRDEEEDKCERRLSARRLYVADFKSTNRSYFANAFAREMDGCMVGANSLTAHARGFSCELLASSDRYAAVLAHGAGADAFHVIAVNRSGVHAVPTALNAHANALLRAVDPGARVDVSFSQFQLTQSQLGNFNTNLLTSIAILLVVAATAFPPPFFVAFIVEEKQLGMKGQLFVSGVTSTSYWLSNFLFDYLPWLFAFALLYLVFGIFNVEFFFEEGILGLVLTSFLGFTLCMVPLAYIVAQFFRDAGLAVLVVLFVGFMQIFIFVIWQGFEAGGAETRALSDRFTPLFRLTPSFCLPEALQVALTLHTQWKFAPVSQRDDTWYEDCAERRAERLNPRWACADDLWDDKAAGGPISAMFRNAAVYTLLVLGVEALYQNPAFRRWMEPKHRAAARADGDAAVQAEQAAVNAGTKQGPIVVRQVHKTYKAGGFRCCPPRRTVKYTHAVKESSWACSEGEVFGLLGVNGAGKSTMFSLLSGIAVPAAGDVQIRGRSMLRQGSMKAARNGLGYCPQHNPLNPLLTVQEHLELYGMVKGLTGESLKVACAAWIASLDLESHKKKQTRTLSGGNKRKLVVALAMIGDPEVILLDEPSAGMDPEARRFMWDVIREIAQTRKQATVVLTTHSMEECEALCGRLAIMVDGTMRCIGTQAEIKQAYGAGRQLLVKLEAPASSAVEAVRAQLAVGGARVKTRAEMEALADSDWLRNGLASDLAPFPPPGEGNRAACAASVPVLAEWWCIAQRVQALVQWVKELDPEATWENWSSCTVRFRLSETGSLPELFGKVHAQKAQLSILEYSLAPTTLEQVFHTFAAQEGGGSGETVGGKKKAHREKKSSALAELLSTLAVPSWPP